MGHAESKLRKKQRIEQMLLHTRSGYTMKDLAAETECSIPTVHRYLKEFESDGVLIKESGGRYKLDAEHLLSNVRLTRLEALSIYLALRRFIRQTSHAPDFMVDALEKVSNVLLTDELRQQLFDASDALRTHAASPQQRRVWENLLAAWQDNLVVEIDYVKSRSNNISTHVFEPYLFEPAVLSHGTYVIGWSRSREELRTLKVSRIQRVTRSTDYFEPPDDLRVDDLLRHAWGVWYGQDLIQVELLFAPEVAERVVETIWHPSQQTERQPDGSLYWTVQVAATLELKPWIRGWGHEVEVLAPASLRQDIAESLRAAAGLYANDGI